MYLLHIVIYPNGHAVFQMDFCTFFSQGGDKLIISLP